MDEETEVSWLTALNRFERETYPTVFEPRGFTKAEALMLWTLNKIENGIADILSELKEKNGLS